MSDFLQRYVARAREVKSMLCFGLDPTPEQVPPRFGDGHNVGCVTRFLMEAIDIAAVKCACVKPQWAFYLAYGPRGYEMLTEITSYAHQRGLLVIEDAKVNDIGNTMDAYGEGVFGQHGVDAVTFTPYLGGTFLPVEEVAKLWVPWFQQGKGVIPMILTSNPEASQLQLKPMEDGRPMYIHAAELAVEWAERVEKLSNGAGMVSGVIGATHPEQAYEIRKILGPDHSALVPGLGAQGGTGEGAIAPMPDSGEPIVMVNSSRELLWYCWFDRKAKQPIDGDPLELMDAMVDDSNLRINDALVERFGSLVVTYG